MENVKKAAAEIIRLTSESKNVLNKFILAGRDLSPGVQNLIAGNLQQIEKLIDKMEGPGNE